MENSRLSERSNTYSICHLSFDDYMHVSGELQNISDTGAFIKTDSTIPHSYEKRKSNVVITNSEKEHYFESIVSRVDNMGVAVKFSSLDVSEKLKTFCTSDNRNLQIKVSIKLDNVSRHWGDNRVINNFQANFKSGEIVALLGPSGGGKSTLLRLLAGVLKPSMGNVLVNGESLGNSTPAQIRKHRSNCSIIEQKHLLVQQNSVHQNIVAGLLGQWSLAKICMAALWPAEQKRVQALLTKLGLLDKEWQLASTLSGGQQQRVAVARALISDPQVILADEPTASLDPATTLLVTSLINEYARLYGSLLVFCTHNLAIVKDHCDRVIGLREGEMLFDEKPGTVNQSMLDELYKGSHERY